MDPATPAPAPTATSSSYPLSLTLSPTMISHLLLWVVAIYAAVNGGGNASTALPPAVLPTLSAPAPQSVAPAPQPVAIPAPQSVSPAVHPTATPTATQTAPQAAQPIQVQLVNPVTSAPPAPSAPVTTTATQQLHFVVPYSFGAPQPVTTPATNPPPTAVSPPAIPSSATPPNKHSSDAGDGKPIMKIASHVRELDIPADDYDPLTEQLGPDAEQKIAEIVREQNVELNKYIPRRLRPGMKIEVGNVLILPGITYFYADGAKKGTPPLGSFGEGCQVTVLRVKDGCLRVTNDLCTGWIFLPQA